jgi:unsaturated rhamnogalacturonyl hydrolase
MFVYALAKGVRMGYLPQADEASARRGWEGIQKAFVTTENGKMALSGTVKVAGLGGKPYRSGTYAYYIGEKTGVNDAKGIGAFLLAGSEMEQAATEALGQRKTVLVDAWFNSQTRQNAAGQTELFHYKWNDDANSGFSFFGRVFQRYGAKLAEEKTAPTAADLKKAQIYILPSPDIPSKNPNPHYMDPKSVDVIANWVKHGGVLLLMENDGPNAEFTHFDTLSDRFGIHFNQVLVNHVVGDDYPAGELVIPAGTGVFSHPHLAYMKDTCTISVNGPAKSVVTKDGHTMIAVAKYGKGTVFAIVDPWVYNEYVDHRNHLPLKYDNFAGAIDLAGWAVRQ